MNGLIGADHYWQLATGKVIQGQCGPTAIHTHLGWVLSGPVGDTAEQNGSSSYSSHTMHVSTTHLYDSPPHLADLLKAFSELESLGIKQDEPSVHEEFKKTINFKNGCYEVSLPWRPDQLRLPNNFDLARKRLQGLLKRLHHHPEIQREYHVVIQKQLQQESSRRSVSTLNRALT